MNRKERGWEARGRVNIEYRRERVNREGREGGE